MMRRVPLVYVAGPFTGKSAWEMEKNIRVAERVALDIWATKKLAAICPHTMNRFFQGARGLTFEDWMRGDLEIVDRCDAVVLCPGWSNSRGTMAEKAAAERKGILVVDVRELDWLQKLLDRFAVWPSVAGGDK
jgi:nucleoside 2-deoxyribosyltransferase